MSQPCGMANLGNTCFLNSCIQLLNNIDEIPDKWSNTVNHSSPSDNLVFAEWLELRAAMKNARGAVISPNKFVYAVHHVAKIKDRELFSGFAQNDLPEFLLFMMECMHNAKKRSVIMKISGTKENSTDDLALKCYSMLKDNYERGDYSEFSDLFYGVYVSRLSSPDGATTHSLKPEPYALLDLPIPDRPRPSLYDCFDEFVGDELLTGWLNEKTNRTEPVRKNIVFWNFPQILIITLKRFSANGRMKNGDNVDFPVEEVLDLSKYAVGYKSHTNKYRLVGVANHMGGVSGGHYTSCGLESDKWYLYNDASVQEIRSTRDIVSGSAYCLWYRKIGTTLREI